jgi:lipopolysaccharide/colanic/teichoic acid biosynthesis glycosyltransferase
MYRKYFKRLFDILLSGLAIMVLSPVWIPVVIVLLLTGEHDIFYFQERIGYRNKTFRIWKFATMRKSTPSLAGGAYSGDPGKWLLPMGRILRKTKINELPQLVNILKGDMSIVGPRPLIARTFEPYPEHVRTRIYDVRPGMTGIGSIIFRDEERLLSVTDINPKEVYNNHISPHKGELELWYQQTLSLSTDLMLIFLTAWVIFFPDSNMAYIVFKNLPEKPASLNGWESNFLKGRLGRKCYHASQDFRQYDTFQGKD